MKMEHINLPYGPVEIMFQGKAYSYQVFPLYVLKTCFNY